jgi:rod shape-determining protein MreD
MKKHQGTWVIIFSFILGFMLAIMPLPAWAANWRPDWLALILIYWTIAAPQRVGVGIGWFIGILHDVLSDTLLGQHAIIYSLIAFFGAKLHKRVRIFPLWQQTMLVFLLISISQLLQIWIRSIIGHNPQIIDFIYPIITSTLLWPWLFILLRDMQRKHKVS